MKDEKNKRRQETKPNTTNKPNTTIKKRGDGFLVVWIVVFSCCVSLPL